MDASENNTSLDSKSKARWFAMRAYKCEGKAEEMLSREDGLEHFIPKRYAVRVYHGVKSKRLVPVIPSLVFVHASRQLILDFKRRCPFLQFMMWPMSSGQEYIIVPDREMESFIKIASQYAEDTTYYAPEEIDIRKGTRVRIHGGRFDGVCGTFMRVKGKRNRRIVVLLDGIMAVAAEVHPDLTEIITG